MPKVNISKSNLEKALSGGLISVPGWYSVEISNYEENNKGEGNSQNWWFYFKILGGLHQGAQKIGFFNEKHDEYVGPLLIAIGAPKNPDGSVTAEWTKEAVMGQRLDIYISRGLNKKTGKEIDQVTEYRPFTAPAGVFAA